MTFWLRGSGQIFFEIATTETASVASGGTCTLASCNENFKTEWIAVPSAWTKYEYLFASLHSNTVNRYMTASDLKKAIFLTFLMKPNTTSDVWIDDVAFLQ